jgi:hypothetical protein
MLTSGFDDGRQWLIKGEAAQAGRTQKRLRRLSPARPRRDHPQSGPAALGASLLFVRRHVADSEPDEVGLHEPQSGDDGIVDMLSLDRVGAGEVFQSFPLPLDVVRVGGRRHEKLARDFVSPASPLRADFFAIVDFCLFDALHTSL